MNEVMFFSIGSSNFVNKKAIPLFSVALICSGFFSSSAIAANATNNNAKTKNDANKVTQKNIASQNYTKNNPANYNYDANKVIKTNTTKPRSNNNNPIT